MYLTETVFCLKSSLNLLILKILQVELLSSWCWFNDVILQDTAHSGYMQSLSTTSNMDRQLSRQKSVKKSQWWKHKRWCFYDLQDKKWIKMPKKKKFWTHQFFCFHYWEFLFGTFDVIIIDNPCIFDVAKRLLYLLSQFILLTQAGNFTSNFAKPAINGCRCIPGYCTVVGKLIERMSKLHYYMGNPSICHFTVSHFFLPIQICYCRIRFDFF